MTHRGRNNLLVCLLGLQAEIMFGKMSGIPEFPFDADHERIIGDVLSHLSISTSLKENGNKVSLLPNPSHLDAINPAAMGKASRVSIFCSFRLSAKIFEIFFGATLTPY